MHNRLEIEIKWLLILTKNKHFLAVLFEENWARWLLKELYFSFQILSYYVISQFYSLREKKNKSHSQ